MTACAYAYLYRCTNRERAGVVVAPAATVSRHSYPLIRKTYRRTRTSASSRHRAGFPTGSSNHPPRADNAVLNARAPSAKRFSPIPGARISFARNCRSRYAPKSIAVIACNTPPRARQYRSYDDRSSAQERRRRYLVLFTVARTTLWLVSVVRRLVD